jgi:hypothetical protein
VARHLIHLSDHARLKQWKQGAEKLATQMTWPLTAEHFVEQMREEYANTTQERKAITRKSSLQYSG